jgi:hypothetical protein
MMRGHYAYYGITGNFRRLSWYAYQVARIWQNWLSRRDRMSRLKWTRFNALLKRHPLPADRRHHSKPDQRLDPTRLRDEDGQHPHLLGRRTFLHLAAGAAALPALSGFACAQAYPSRPVRLIVGFAAGGPTDILARLIGQWLSQRLGQPFLIENRPGAGGNIATEVVVNAEPDGYTLLLIAPANTINATLYDKLSYNFIRDVAPVAGFLRTFYVMEVTPSVPAKTVPEFIAYAQANPGKVNMASAGSGRRSTWRANCSA